MTHGGCVKSVVRCRAKNMSQFFFSLRLRAPEREMPLALTVSPMTQLGESPARPLNDSQVPPASENRTPAASEGRTYTHFLNSNIETIQEEEVRAAAEVVAISSDEKRRSRHKRNQSLHHVLHVKNILNQDPPQDQQEAEEASPENEAMDGSINIIIEPQEQENDQIKLDDEFDNERIQNTINNIAMNQEHDQLRCSIIDDKIDSGEELQTAQPVSQPMGSMFNQMFDASPGLCPALPSGRTHYNETILEHSQE